MNAIPDECRYLKKPTAAVYLDTSIDTIERLIADGTLTARKLRGNWRIDRQEIDDYMAGKRRRRRAS